MGYQNIGPNYWKGEEGRLALIAGEQKLTDAAVGRAVRQASPSGRTTSATASRRRPTPTARTSSPSAAPRSTRPAPGRSRRSAPRSPAPSRWAPSRRRCRTTGDTCYISDHVDIAHRHERRVAERRGGARPSSSGSARRSSPQLYANALPGFFPLLEPAGDARGPAGAGVRRLARDLRERRSARPTRSCRAARPNLENETWNASANVIRGTETPEAAAARLQEGLAAWYDAAEVSVRAARTPAPAPPSGRGRSSTAPESRCRWPTDSAVPLAHPGVPRAGGARLHRDHDHPALRDAEPRALQPRRGRPAASSASTTSAPSSATRAGRRASGTRSATTPGSS